MRREQLSLKKENREEALEVDGISVPSNILVTNRL